MRASLAIAFLLSSMGARSSSAQCNAWRGFESPAVYSSSAEDTVLIRDLDGDGAPDIVVSGNHVDERDAFSLFRNRGNGTFDPEQLIPSGSGKELEDIGDLNGDGVPDIVASDYWSNGIVVYRGLGALRFAAGVAYGTATHGGPTRIVDYDHDGTEDLVSLSFGSGNPVRVHLFHGNGDGVFAPKQTIDTSLANAATPSLRTVNGDLEILAGERAGNLALLRIAGGTMTVTRIGAGPGFDLASAFADVNGDGTADIVDADDSAGDKEPIFVTLANADGTFRERKQLTTTRHLELPVEVRVGDFDGDGNADLLVSDFRGSSLYWFRGDGSGAFGEGIAVKAGGPVNSFAVADVNGDGYLDVVTANNDHTVSVVLNRGCAGARRRAVSH